MTNTYNILVAYHYPSQHSFPKYEVGKSRKPWLEIVNVYTGMMEDEKVVLHRDVRGGGEFYRAYFPCAYPIFLQSRNPG